MRDMYPHGKMEGQASDDPTAQQTFYATYLFSMYVHRRDACERLVLRPAERHRSYLVVSGVES